MQHDTDPAEASQTSKDASCYLKLRGVEAKERVGLKRKIEMTRWIFGSVTLCNRWVAGIHLPWEKGTENTPHGLQWDFSNYLLLHIWMRWLVRGLEACPALPPSENHLQSDFKNIAVMLQDKSLITGNYGLPILPHWPFSPFCKSPLPHPHFFYPLIEPEKQPGRGNQAWWRGRQEGLLPERHWSWPLTLYCTSIHVEWLTCGQQLPTKSSKLGLVMKRLDGLSDWPHYSFLVCRALSCAFKQGRASASHADAYALCTFLVLLCKRKAVAQGCFHLN